MAWKKGYSQIIDGNVVMSEPFETYYPFELYSSGKGPCIYLDFISIDETNQKSIIDFCNKYGLLLLDQDFFHALNKIYSLPISFFTTALSEMRNVFILRMSLNSYKYFREGLLALESLNPIDIEIYQNFLNENNSLSELNKYDYFCYLARSTFIWVVNNHLKGVSPKLLLYDGKYHTDWHCENLITIMYTMLQLDLAGGAIHARCQNETCPRYFTVSSTNKKQKYCSPFCENAQSQRNHRKKVQQKKNAQKSIENNKKELK